MAITVPSGCYRQPSEQEGVDANGNKTFAYILKGGYNELKTLLGTLDNGDEIVSGWVMSTANLVRSPGGTGILTINCVPNDTTSGGEGGSSTQEPLTDTWQLRSVRNDVSILAYCGPNAANPQRELIEAWMKEPDGKLAKDDKFTQSDGSVYTISESPTLTLMGKIRKGIEAVVRFYPMVIRTRVYSKCPTNTFSGLGRTGTPNGACVPSGYSWLKCQDDLTQDTSGKWHHVEAWMGTPSSPGWDSDLYGANAWSMPYQG